VTGGLCLFFFFSSSLRPSRACLLSRLAPLPQLLLVCGDLHPSTSRFFLDAFFFLPLPRFFNSREPSQSEGDANTRARFFCHGQDKRFDSPDTLSQPIVVVHSASKSLPTPSFLFSFHE
jgi:hypothetical protein